MRLVRTTAQFRRSSKKILRSGRFDRAEIQDVVDVLIRGEKLDLSYRDHELSGDLLGHRECHIRPDLLLLYRIEGNDLILVLVNLGSHSDLFG